MKALSFLVAFLLFSSQVVAQQATTGTVTGRVKLWPTNCSQVDTSSMYGVIAIPGTSFASHFKGDGRYAMYNVKPGRYTLALWSFNSPSYSPNGTMTTGGSSALRSIVVRPGRTTQANLTLGESCCGNGVQEGDEVCDSTVSDDVTCASLGYDSAPDWANVSCTSTCEYYTGQCESEE